MIPTLQTTVWAEVDLSWGELADALKLPTPTDFPVPLPKGKSTFVVSAEATLGDSAGLRLKVEGAYPVNPEENSFLGFTIGPAVKLVFEGAVSSAEELSGSVTFELSVKLPQLPELDLVRIHSGDSQGWTTLRVTAAANTSSAFDFTIEIFGGVQVDLYLPGLATPEPPLHLELESFAGKVHLETGNLSGALNAVGSFAFRPRLADSDLPAVEYLKPVFEDLMLSGSVDATLTLSSGRDAHQEALVISGVSTLTDSRDVRMTIKASVLLAEENPEVCVNCKFKGLEIYPFGLLRQLVQSPRRSDQDPKVGPACVLNGFYLCLSRTPHFGIEMAAKLSESQEIPAFFKISTTEFSLGLGHVLPGEDGGAIPVPLRLPQISRENFQFLKDKPIKESRNSAETRPIDQAIYERVKADDSDAADRYDEFMQLYFDTIEQISGVVANADNALIAYEENGAWHVKPPAKPAVSDSSFSDFNQRVAMGLVGVRKSDGSFETKGDLAILGRVKQDQWEVLLAKPTLSFDQFSFSMSFRNPRDIRVSGTVGFLTEGWFNALSNLRLRVELSAELISFSVEVNEQTKIEIPEIIPGYTGGSIAIGKLKFGFGYLKRSLAVAFAGELVLPEKLVDDLDTSDVLGAGIRLPIKSQLAFQFDLMPFVIKEVVILIPLFQFNWDLRQDVSPGLVDSRTCEPFWDGLQLIVPDVIRCSLKRISYSPIFLCYCSSSSDFDGDLVLGDSQNGLTIVADNVYWDYGIDCAAALVMAPIAWPPFVDNFCVNLKLGGFGLHLNFQRPVPSFSPLGVFEMLALMVDPLYEIAPRGELANSVRVTVEDAYIILPDTVRRLFPQAASFLQQPINETINIATFLSFLQRMVKPVKPVAEKVVEALRDGRQVAGELQGNIANLGPAEIAAMSRDLLGMLPPELRKLRMEASFAGFEASVLFLLTDAKGLRDSRQGNKPDEVVGKSGNTKWMYEPNIRPLPGVPRLFDAGSSNSDLFAEPEFAGFEIEDLDSIVWPGSKTFYTPADITPALIGQLKFDSRRIGALVKTLLITVSPRLQELLEQYTDGPVPEALRRELLAALNSLVKGEGLPHGTIYRPAWFIGVALQGQLWERVREYPVLKVTGEELYSLNRELLDAIYPNDSPGPIGLVVAARVRVFGNQRFRFIGCVFSDGSFSLLTAARVEPLQLTVAGIVVPLAFAAEGRLRLIGKATSEGIAGSIEARGRASWIVGDGLLTISVGVRQPAELELFSDGKFRFSADAVLTFFDNSNCRMEAVIDVSDTHSLVAGEFHLSSGLIANRRLFDLHVHADGRIGPGAQFSFSFVADQKKDSASSLYGIPIAHLRGTITESRLELETTLTEEGHRIDWPGSGDFQPPVKITKAILKGWIDPRKTLTPDFSLEGEMAVQLFDDGVGPAIDGRGGISARNDRLAMFVAGNLNWQGCEWVGGRVEVNDSEVRVSGQCDLALDLKPGDLIAADLNLAGLYFQLKLGGSFTLDHLGGLKKFDLKLHWFLAARLDQTPDQILPLASQSLSAGGGSELKIDLVKGITFKLVPTDSLEVPVPEIVPGENIEITKCTLGYTLTAGPFKLRIGQVPSFQLGFDVAVPIVREGDGHPLPFDPNNTDIAPSKNWDTGSPITIPTFTLGAGKNVSPNLVIESLNGLSISLVWNKQGLGLSFGSGNHVVMLNRAYPPS